MKNRSCLVILFIILFSIPLTETVAQSIEIVPFAGYQTSAKINAYERYFRVNDGLALGGSAAFGRNAYKIELSYTRQSTSLTYYPDDNSAPTVTNLAVSFASIGGLLEFMEGSPVLPFVKVAIGGTYYTPVDSDTESENVMHFDISGGARFLLNDHFGFRLQAALLLPVFFEGLYFEEAAPAEGEGMKTKIAGVQGNLTGGVIIRF